MSGFRYTEQSVGSNGMKVSASLEPRPQFGGDAKFLNVGSDHISLYANGITHGYGRFAPYDTRLTNGAINLLASRLVGK